MGVWLGRHVCTFTSIYTLYLCGTACILSPVSACASYKSGIVVYKQTDSWFYRRGYGYKLSDHEQIVSYDHHKELSEGEVKKMRIITIPILEHPDQTGATISASDSAHIHPLSEARSRSRSIRESQREFKDQG